MHMFRSVANFLRYRPFIKERKRKEYKVAEEALAAPEILESAPVVSSPFQAVKLLQAFHVSPLSERVELALKLDVDLKRHSVRGIINLPHGIATEVKLLVFCPDNEADEMIKAGADFAGLTDIISRINKGWLGFDKCIATPAMMPHVLKVAKILGPKKLMPNPKSGNIVENLKLAIAETKAGGSVEFRAENDGEVVVPIGLTGFSDAAILDNFKCVVRELLKQKPRETKKVADAKAKEPFFVMQASLRAGAGPMVAVDPDRMQLSSSGYFR